MFLSHEGCHRPLENQGKPHKGSFKVPILELVTYSVTRSGQKGHHRRTEITKKVYRIGAAIHKGAANRSVSDGATEPDITDKSINPMGGCGEVKNDCRIGCCIGLKKHVLTLCKSLISHNKRKAANFKRINRSFRFGDGRCFRPMRKRELQ